jgi:hypothetical protein
MNPWLEYLSALEANVARGWNLLESDRPAGPELAAELADVDIPDGLAPCPEPLQARAVEVLRAIGELEAAIVSRQQELARQLQQRPQLPVARDRVGWGLSIRM